MRSMLGASIIATAIGAVVVAAAFYLSSKPKISRSTMVVAVTLLSVGVLAAGIGGAIAGPAELPHEESTSAEHGAMGAPGQSDVTAISSMADQLREMKKEDWLEITEAIFDGLFSQSAVKRAGYAGLKRNIQFLSALPGLAIILLK